MGILIFDRDRSRPRLQVIALWVDTRKEGGSHSTTFAVDAGLMRNDYDYPLLLSVLVPFARIDCLAFRFLSSWLSSINVKDITSFIKNSGRFSTVE